MLPFYFWKMSLTLPPNNSVGIFSIKLYFEIIVDAHVVVRSNTERSCVHGEGSHVELLYPHPLASCSHFLLFNIYIYIYIFIYFWLRWVFVAVRGLSVVAVSGGLLFVAVCGLLIVVASVVAEHGL